ncbi:MAG: amidohydrolase family protein [Planctomycetota bacterium]|jgi:imidazolonepropionase-like amidohydrolase
MRRRSPFLPILTAVFLVAGSLGTAVAEEGIPLVIRNGVILDGNGGEPIEEGVLVIQEGLITAVGKAGAVPLPPNARVIDATGKSVMPGLADMHVHLGSGWTGFTMDLLGYQTRLNAFLHAGVTTVLDTGNVQPFILQLRQEIEAGRIAGPRVFSLGPLLDSSDPIWPHIAFPVASADQIPKLVKRLDDAGVDGVKLYLGLNLKMIRSFVAEAKKASLPVVVDQWTLNGDVDLVRAGVTAFAHMPFRTMNEEALREMAKRKVRCLTTLTIYEALARERLAKLDYLDHPLVRDTTPARVLLALRKEAARAPTEYDRIVREGYGRIEDAMKNVKKLFDAGVLLTAGTDSPFTGLFQGEGIHRELELLVASGLTPLQAITLATRNAAAFLDAEGAWGTLAVGHRADVLIVAGRPDRDIAHTRNVETVIQAGRIIDRNALKFDPKRDRDHRAYKLVYGGE